MASTVFVSTTTTARRPATPTKCPEGRYFLVAGSDLDNDGRICHSGEACAEYPVAGLREEVTVTAGQALTNLQLTTSYARPTISAATPRHLAPAGLSRLPFAGRRERDVIDETAVGAVTVSSRKSCRKSLARCLPLVGLALLSGCAGSGPRVPPELPSVRQVTQSQHCGLTGPGLLLVTSQPQLSQYLGLPAQNLSVQPLRSLDLNREVLLFVTMGQKPTAGYSVRLASAALTGDTLDLSVAVRTPPADSVQAQVMTSPCAILALEPGKWNAIRLHGLTERPLLLRP